MICVELPAERPSRKRAAISQPTDGAIDFQPREPFHPLFGAMPRTPLALEVQITKEYLGADTHLVYLGTMWQEVLRSDTHAKGPGSLVARDLTSIYPPQITKLPNVGYHRALSAEGIVSLRPSILLTDGNVGPNEVLDRAMALFWRRGY